MNDNRFEIIDDKLFVGYNNLNSIFINRIDDELNKKN